MTRLLRLLRVAWCRVSLRPLPLFGLPGDPLEAAHDGGYSLAEQLMGHRRGEQGETRYIADPRWSREAIAEAARELDKRARRIAAAESRRKREAGVAAFRKRRSA